MNQSKSHHSIPVQTTKKPVKDSMTDTMTSKVADIAGSLDVNLFAQSKVNSRKTVLDEAAKCVLKDRNATHGNPEDSFGRTAKMWSAYLGSDVSSADVAALLALLKIARIKETPDHADNWVDLAGYAACGGELALS
jgi:hypothetical protein